ncbi:hypothetical protein JHK86_022672 [Glycine max]|nr:hypothetical protein JHK86_022672 [Glycine max]
MTLGQLEMAKIRHSEVALHHNKFSKLMTLEDYVDCSPFLVVQRASVSLLEWIKVKKKEHIQPQQRMHNLRWQKPPPVIVTKTEALACLEAINWLRELGYQCAIIEIDCKGVVDGVRGNCTAQSN